jgi:fatty-acid desaturase
MCTAWSHWWVLHSTTPSIQEVDPLMPDLQPSSPGASAAAVGRVITALLIVSPIAAIAVSVPLLWGHAIHLRDVVLAAILYAVTGHGVTVGFHRLFTPRGFTPQRPLKIALDGELAAARKRIREPDAELAVHRRATELLKESADPKGGSLPSP